MATAMENAFARAGITRQDARAFATAQEFIANGGTLGRWIAIWRQAEAKRKGEASGQIAPDDKVQARHAAASPPPRDGAGQPHAGALGPIARPAREPSPAQRAAAASVARTVAVTVLDTYRIRDGRAIGDVRFGELERLRSANAAEASLIRQIQRHATAGHDALVRDVVKADDLQRMIQKAAEVADAA